MAAEVDARATVGPPRQIFAAGFTTASDWWTRPYSLAPDGRFLVIRNAANDAARPSEIHVVVNWFPELRRLSPNP